MIHFDLCIVGHRGPTSFFCMWTFSCPCTICWKDNPFVIELSSHTNQKSPDYKLEHLLPELSIIYHWSSVYLYTNTMLSWLLLLCSKFWSKKIWVFQLPFFFQNYFGYTGSPGFPHQFKDQLVCNYPNQNLWIIQTSK